MILTLVHAGTTNSEYSVVCQAKFERIVPQRYKHLFPSQYSSFSYDRHVNF